MSKVLYCLDKLIWWTIFICKASPFHLGCFFLLFKIEENSTNCDFIVGKSEPFISQLSNPLIDDDQGRKFGCKWKYDKQQQNSLDSWRKLSKISFLNSLLHYFGKPCVTNFHVIIAKYNYAVQSGVNIQYSKYVALIIRIYFNSFYIRLDRTSLGFKMKFFCPLRKCQNYDFNSKTNHTFELSKG